MSTFDRIFASTPADRTAAVVTSSSAIGYEPEVRSPRQFWREPPPVQPGAGSRKLLGAKVGRLTVLGIAAEQRDGDGSTWVVRCVCGTYETRRARELRAPESSDDRCQFCEHTNRLRKLVSKPRSIAQQLTDMQQRGTDRDPIRQDIRR